MCVTVHHINTVYRSVFGFIHIKPYLHFTLLVFLNTSVNLLISVGLFPFKLSYLIILDLHVITPPHPANMDLVQEFYVRTRKMQKREPK